MFDVLGSIPRDSAGCSRGSLQVDADDVLQDEYGASHKLNALLVYVKVRLTQRTAAAACLKSSSDNSDIQLSSSHIDCSILTFFLTRQHWFWTLHWTFMWVRRLSYFLRNTALSYKCCRRWTGRRDRAFWDDRPRDLQNWWVFREIFHVSTAFLVERYRHWIMLHTYTHLSWNSALHREFSCARLPLRRIEIIFSGIEIREAFTQVDEETDKQAQGEWHIMHFFDASSMFSRAHSFTPINQSTAGRCQWSGKRGAPTIIVWHMCACFSVPGPGESSLPPVQS